jgi:hypothetical protein
VALIALFAALAIKRAGTAGLVALSGVYAGRSWRPVGSSF